jgi:hypothetical protein
LKPVIEGIRETYSRATPAARKQLEQTRITADSGYHNRATLEYLEQEGIDGYLADTGFRSRDPRFRDHKERPERNKRRLKNRFSQSDFEVNQNQCTARCPAGHAMWLKSRQARIGQHLFMQFQAYEQDCADCHLKARCLRSLDQKTPRQLNVVLSSTPEQRNSIIERMKRKIDGIKGRHIYSQRLGTVEPVFGHITDGIGIRRFSLRGKRKVDGQWKLLMMLHNILKIHRYGWEWS